MEREQIVRNDFPLAVGEEGFDRGSVVAHLTAVAAHVAALESMITALEVEREALRRRLGAGSPDEHPTGSHPVPFTRTGPPSSPAAQHDVFPEDGHQAAARFGATALKQKPSASAPESAIPADGREDEVAARLAASTLALEGADRETIRARLDSEFQLADLDDLLDDVLARLG